MLIRTESAPNETRTSALAMSANVTPIEKLKPFITLPPGRCCARFHAAFALECSASLLESAQRHAPSLKQLHIARHLDVHQTPAVILLTREHRIVVQRAQLLHQHPAGGRKEIDLASTFVEQILRQHLYALLAQIIDDEARVTLADPGAAQIGQHAA